MSHVANDKIIDDIRDQETTLLEDLEYMQYLVECAKVWVTLGISLKEAYKQIDELKIRFAIIED